MSLRDDSLPPSDEPDRGKFRPGHKGLNQHTKVQPEQPSGQPTQDVSDASFDDDLIAAANDYGKPRSKIGRRAWCENLRDTRPVEFAALLSKALARKADEQTNIVTGSAGVTVSFVTAPSGMYVDENGKLQEAADAREAWSRKTGMKLTDEPPPTSPLPFAPPVLVHPRDDDDEVPKPKWTKPKW